MFETISGRHPGFRPMHTQGILLTGTFHPTPAAASLSRVLHFARPATPISAWPLAKVFPHAGVGRRYRYEFIKH
ncbi:MAG: hypothetical protein H7Z75_16485 [Ferruginibacter sp.]|nr:hypothetical protein [Cytophagales bacterium]